MASSSGAGPKPQFSSSLMRLKFMQKGAAKRQQPDAGKEEKNDDDAQEEPKADDSKWTATTLVAKGCKVVVERDPLPAAARSGRMSFGKAPEASAAQHDTAQRDPEHAAAGPGDKQGGKQRGQDGRMQDAVLPLRPPKRQRR